MSSYLKYLVACILIATVELGHSQVTKCHGDSLLKEYVELHDFKKYFKRLRDLGETAYKANNAEELTQISTCIKLNYGTLAAIDKVRLRNAAALIAQYIWNLKGDIDESLELYLIGHQNVLDPIMLDTFAWFVENRISNLYTRKGDFQKADYFAGLVKNSLRKHGQLDLLSRYYTNLAVIKSSQFRTEESISLLLQGYHLADSIGYVSGVFGNVINLAGIYNDNPSLGSPELYLKKASEILPQLITDTKYCEKKADLEIEIAKYKSNKGNYDESIDLYSQALNTLNQCYSNSDRREFAKYYASIARIYLSADSIDAASRSINEGLASLINSFAGEISEINHFQLYAENSFIDLFQANAEILQKKYQNKNDANLLFKILHSIDLALYVNDLIRHSVAGDPSKLASISVHNELIEIGITSLYELHKTGHDIWGNTRMYFDRSKSLLLAEKTYRNFMLDYFTIEDKEKWKIIQDSLLEIYGRTLNPNEDLTILNGILIRLQENLDKVFINYDSIQITVIEPINYIEYYVGNRDVFALSVINDSRSFVNLGKTEELKALLDRLNEYLVLKNLSEDTSITSELYTFLLGPILDEFDGDIKIIPDDIICYIPFELLKDRDYKYLLEKVNISYAFEFREFAPLIDKLSDSNKILCLAPEYGSKEYNIEEVVRGGIYPLPYARMEVDSISKTFGIDSKVILSIDKYSLLNKLDSFEVFHFAGHAIVEKENAYLVLDGNGTHLTGDEIGLNSSKLQMVVLSACETGLGSLEKGEGIRSLGRRFLESGTRAIIISLWNVNDKSTGRIMTDYYKNLREGIRKDQALRIAKLNYYKNPLQNQNHPYYWAGLVPFGDMNKIFDD